MTVRGSDAGAIRGSGQGAIRGTTPPAHRILDRVVLAVLIVDGFISAVLGVLFLPTYLGGVAFPISALVSGVVNVLLVLAARSLGGPGRWAAWPMVGWGVGFLLCAAGGPGGDVLLPVSWQSFVFLVLGLLPAGYVIYRGLVAAPPRT